MPLDTSAFNNGHPIGLAPLPPYTARAPSIRSFTSAAPSYHSTVPAYHSTLTPLPRISSEPRTSIFHRPSGSLPTSHIRQNPNARAYHSIAARRAEASSQRDAAELRAAGVDRNPERAVRVVVLRREEEEFGLGEEGGKRVRPLEDSELVGEEAAERNRRERLRREGNEVLEREDRRWEWMLAQMEDWTAREESWKNFKGKQEKKKGQGMRNFMNGLGARLGR